MPWFVLPSESYWTEDVGHLPPASAYNAIAAAFLGDESDDSFDKTWDVWTRQMKAEENMAASSDVRYATYDGGHVNHYNGAFAGVTDIQGMDFYVAGCAPHITFAVQTMRIQGSYDYLYTSRQNMKPIPSWGYTQAFCVSCWSGYPLNAGELLVQFASVISAGSKGIMLFQSDVNSKQADENAWALGEIGRAHV